MDSASPDPLTAPPRPPLVVVDLVPDSSSPSAAPSNRVRSSPRPASLCARAAEYVEGRGDGRVRLLRDRRLPGSLVGVDLLALGPGGVTVFGEAHPLSGAAGGALSRAWGRVVSGLRPGPGCTEGIELTRVAVVEMLAELGRGDVEVLGVLCLPRSSSPRDWVRTSAGGSIVRVGPRGAAAVAERSGSLDALAVERLWLTLAARLPRRDAHAPRHAQHGLPHPGA